MINVQKKRTKFEDKNLGKFERIYPGKVAESLNENYELFMQYALISYQR